MLPQERNKAFIRPATRGSTVPDDTSLTGYDLGLGFIRANSTDAIKNYLCLAEVSIRFGDITTFIGPNGAGKSAVLRALTWRTCARRRGKGTESPDGQAIRRRFAALRRPMRGHGALSPSGRNRAAAPGTGKTGFPAQATDYVDVR